MPQTEREGILATCVGNFIDEGFECEHIAVRAERTQCRGAHRHRQQTMVGDRPCREVVQRYCVALGAASAGESRVDGNQRLERLLQMRRGEQGRCFGAARARAVAVAGHVVFPVDDVAVLIERGFEVYTHGRAERCPAQLLRARPLQAHGAAWRGAGEQGGVVGHVVCAIVAVAASALNVMHGDGGRIACERESEVGTQIENALAVRPDFESAGDGIAPARQRAGGANRGMCDETA